jgi:type IV secretion system protein VirB10
MPNEAGIIQDRRSTPRGVLPRQLQMWLMVGLAVVILLIILVTGHAQPVARTAAPPATAPTPTLATADRIRRYQQQLAADDARQQQLLAQQAALEQADAQRLKTNGGTVSADPLADERHRREYHSLFADNVAWTRRATGSGRPASPAAVATAAPVSAPTPPIPQVEPEPGIVRSPESPDPESASMPRVGRARTPVTDGPRSAHDEYPAEGPRLRVLEGSVIETTLINRLEGTFSGPVACLVTTPVYTMDRSAVVIPAGARVLGVAAPVQTWGDTRLALSFHRLIMPDGHSYSLDRFKGLDQIGATGVRDEVNRHYAQVFGASLAIGAISGLAQYNTRAGLDTTFGDASRQAAGASLATSTSRVLDRYLNVLPTITIREGFRIKVLLTNDLELPAYAPAGGGQ